MLVYLCVDSVYLLHFDFAISCSCCLLLVSVMGAYPSNGSRRLQFSCFYFIIFLSPYTHKTIKQLHTHTQTHAHTYSHTHIYTHTLCCCLNCMRIFFISLVFLFYFLFCCRRWLNLLAALLLLLLLRLLKMKVC